MKNKNLILSTLVLVTLSFCFVGCDNSKSKKIDNNEIANDSIYIDQAQIKEEIVTIIKKILEPQDITILLNEAGASYIADLTVPIEVSEKVISQDKMSFLWGMYVFDMIYANTYNRNDKFLKIRDLENKMKADLNLTDELEKLERYNDRIKQNKGNDDSIKVIIDESSKIWFDEMSNNHFNVLIYSCIGNNIEAIYVLSQLTLLASDNSKLFNIINTQHKHINNIFSLLELISSDENIKPFYKELVDIANIFKQNEIITEKELNEIAPLIEKARNKIIL